MQPHYPTTTLPTSQCIMHALEACTSHKSAYKIVNQKVEQKATLHTIMLHRSMTILEDIHRMQRRLVYRQSRGQYSNLDV